MVSQKLIECVDCHKSYTIGYMSKFRFAGTTKYHVVDLCMWCAANFNDDSAWRIEYAKPAEVKSLGWTIERRPKGEVNGE